MTLLTLVLGLVLTPLSASAQTEYLYLSGVKPGVEPVLEVLTRQHDCSLLPSSPPEVWILACPPRTEFPQIPSVNQWRVSADLPALFRASQPALIALAQAGTIPERMGALRYLSLHPRAWRGRRRASPDFPAAISAAQKTLEDWRAAAAVIEGPEGGPMHDLFADIVLRLPEVSLPETTRLFLLQAANVRGERLPQPSHRLLRDWLDWWGGRIGELERLPESASWEVLRPEEWRGSDFATTKFPNLGLIGRTFEVERRTPARMANLFLHEGDPSWALAVLGLASQADDAKNEILSFIAAYDAAVGLHMGKFRRTHEFSEFTRRLQIKTDQMDLALRFFRSAIEAEDLSTQKPEVWRSWESVRQSLFRESAAAPFLGHRLLYRLIESLAKPNPAFARLPEFSEKVYAASVYDLVTALIAGRRDLLHTRASYWAALDAAIGWQKVLRRTPEGRAILRSRGMRARDEALNQAVRTALLEPLPRLPRAACEILLSPQD